MPVIFTGNDIDGVSAGGRDNIYVTRAGQYVSNEGTAFTFGSSFGNTYIMEGSIYASGFSAFGIESTSSNVLRITDTGSVTSTGNGVNWVGRMSNEGTITGDVSAVRLDSNLSRLTNTGLIDGDSYGVFLAGTNARVFNDGIITSLNRAISGSTSTSTGTNQISNTGLIEARSGFEAIGGTSAIELVFNTGTIFGEIELYAGDDSYWSGSTGVVFGTVFGGRGDDTLRGGDEIDIFDGGDNNDTLRGGGGADELRGGSGADTLQGEAGDDFLGGGGGNDRMEGGAGDDELLGFSGNDILNGGRGDDMMVGGLGVDTFEFYRTAGDDRIFAFQNGIDKIDLSAFAVNFAQVNAAITNRNGNALIDLTELGGDGSVFLRGAGGQLDASDFIL